MCCAAVNIATPEYLKKPVGLGYLRPQCSMYSLCHVC